MGSAATVVAAGRYGLAPVAGRMVVAVGRMMPEAGRVVVAVGRVVPEADGVALTA